MYRNVERKRSICSGGIERERYCRTHSQEDFMIVLALHQERQENYLHCGGKHYSADFPQGGLEIPCILRFEGGDKEISSEKTLPSSRSVTLYIVMLNIVCLNSMVHE